MTRMGVLAGAGMLLASAAHAAPPLPEDIDSVCLETILENCEVTASGRTSAFEGPSIAFQLQRGESAHNGLGGGVVLFADRGGDWTLLATDFGGFEYEVPLLTARAMTLLHVPGLVAGTGSINADLLFSYDDDEDAWRPVDTESWKAEVGPLLPDGLEIWKGVDYDFADWYYAEYTARTELWRAGDANCCPSGGWAIIHFNIVDNVLLPVSVDHSPPDQES